MMTATILDKIVAEKGQEVEQKKQSLPVSALKERVAHKQAHPDFATALRGSEIRLPLRNRSLSQADCP